MQTSAVSTPSAMRKWGDNALSISVSTWLATALIGQWLFVVYVVLFYGTSLVSNDLQQWSQVLPNGIVEGEPFGNLMIILHIMIPAYVMVAGGLQLIPMIRNRYRKFHRINGRIYLTTAVLTSVTGIFMILTRGTVGDGIQHLLTTFNGLLILLFAYFTVDMAMRKNFAEHRQWAMRLFVVVSGVWTFRVMLMFWLTINGGPVGIDFETFTGPAIKILNVAQFALPLIVLEFYFAASKSTSQLFKTSVSGLIVLTTLCMAVGIFAAFMGMWLPRIS
jgi:uncharacterized membrane protein